MIKCFRCDRTAPDHTLYRVNAKGVDAIWACRSHRIERDSELDAIIAYIQSGLPIPKSSVINLADRNQ
jgi:hypothetical protein